MGFSNEWEKMYQTGAHNSIWPWSDVVSLTNHYLKKRISNKESIRVFEVGCGAGANIPFFISIGADYYGIEGSETKTYEVNSRFAGEKVNIVCGDFTKDFPFDGEFDLILDRSSITHNSTEDIMKVIGLINGKLSIDGYFFGIDWFTKASDEYSDKSNIVETVDDNTFVFGGGYFEGLGRVHLSDEQHIYELFSDMNIIEMYTKEKRFIYPEKRVEGRHKFVASRRGE